MLYQSEYLSEEENSFVRTTVSLEQSIELICTTVAQVYIYDPNLMNTWTHVSTGVLFLGRTFPDNYLTMGLFHLLKMMIEWEEEVYQEMTFKCEEGQFLISEGKKRVFLLNFLGKDECHEFLKLFNESQTKDDENDYEKVDDEEHIYEAVLEAPGTRKETVKEEKKRLKLQKEQEKAEKKRLAKEEKARKKLEKSEKKKDKEKEKKKLVIGGPDPDTFQHKCHAGFDSNGGFVIEGMKLDEIQELLKEAGKSYDLYKEQSADKRKMKNKASTLASAKRYITEFPPENAPRRASNSVVETRSTNRESIAPKPKPEVQSKPTPNPRPQIQPKPVIKTKPQLMSKPGVRPKPSGFLLLPKIEEATLVPLLSKNVPPAPKMLMVPMETSVVSQNTSKIPNSTDDRSDLLAAICLGHKLRSVSISDEDTKRSSNVSQRKETGMTEALRQAIVSRGFNGGMDEGEEERTYFPGDAFE